jgi:hypothetical protein
MINITYIYLVENCFNDPNHVYIGKTKNPKDRKTSHKKTYGRQIIYTIIDQVNSLNHKDWKPIETMWIQSFIGWGFDVQNIKKEGGSGSNEWTEEQKNNRRGKGTGPNPLITKAKTNHPGISKTVLQYDLEGNFIKEWKSCAEVGRVLFDGKSQCINDCASGRQKIGYGYQWFYKEDNYAPPNQYKRTRSDGGKVRCRPVLQLDLQNNFIKEFESAAHAAKILGFNQPDIQACCSGKIKTAKGFVWKYKEYYKLLV